MTIKLKGRRLLPSSEPERIRGGVKLKPPAAWPEAKVKPPGLDPAGLPPSEMAGGLNEKLAAASAPSSSSSASVTHESSPSEPSRSVASHSSSSSSSELSSPRWAPGGVREKPPVEPKENGVSARLNFVGSLGRFGLTAAAPKEKPFDGAPSSPTRTGAAAGAGAAKPEKEGAAPPPKENEGAGAGAVADGAGAGVPK